jgi:hypothetical protein
VQPFGSVAHQAYGSPIFVTEYECSVRLRASVDELDIQQTLYTFLTLHIMGIRDAAVHNVWCRFVCVCLISFADEEQRSLLQDPS